MTDEVLARLMLRTDYHAPDELVYEARKRLARLGFRVQQADPTGISFAADRARFEAFFGTRLEPRDTTMLSEGGREARRSHLEATEPIEVPAELADVGAAVVLPRPPELFR